MNRRRGQVYVVGVLMLTALMVGGCNNDPDPVVTPSPTPTPTETAAPSPSPTPTELTDEEIIEAIPPLARQEDFIGAQEFTKFFLASYNRMWQDDNDLLFNALTSSECEFCDLVRQDYLELRAEGSVTTGGEALSMSEHVTGGLQEDGNWGLEIEVHVEPLITQDSQGNETDVAPGGPGLATVILEYEGHWRVLAIGAKEA